MHQGGDREPPWNPHMLDFQPQGLRYVCFTNRSPLGVGHACFPPFEVFPEGFPGSSRVFGRRYHRILS